MVLEKTLASPLDCKEIHPKIYNLVFVLSEGSCLLPEVEFGSEAMEMDIRHLRIRFIVSEPSHQHYALDCISVYSRLEFCLVHRGTRFISSLP